MVTQAKDIIEELKERRIYCPHCDSEIIGTTSEILTHQNTPSFRLPTGLVYFSPQFKLYNLITDTGVIQSGVNMGSKDYTHSINHFVARYITAQERFEAEPVVRNSRDIEQRLKSKAIRLLSLEEFLRFNEVYQRMLSAPDSIPQNIYSLLSKVQELESVYYSQNPLSTSRELVTG